MLFGDERFHQLRQGWVPLVRVMPDIKRDDLGERDLKWTDLLQGEKEFGFAVQQLTDGSGVGGLNPNELFGGLKVREEPPFPLSLVIDSKIDGVTDDFPVSFLR